MSENASTTLPAVVEKVIRPVQPGEPEKAQIGVQGADHLYRELRIENALVDENGERVKLKPGDEVDVTIETSTDGTASHKEPAEKSDNGKKKHTE